MEVGRVGIGTGTGPMAGSTSRDWPSVLAWYTMVAVNPAGNEVACRVYTVLGRQPTRTRTDHRGLPAR